MVPIFDSGHILTLCKYADEIGLIVETAVIAYLRGAQGCARQKIARLCNSKVIDIGNERDTCLLLEEMAECRFRHIHQHSHI